MEDDDRVLIVGASHASAQLCASLRQEGWNGAILLIGDEPSLPYHRPPLSKTYLAGESSLEDLLIRKPAFYEKHRIDFRQGRVASIDREAGTVTLADGEVLAYAKLVLCLGARPRRLSMPGSALAGVHYLRDASDITGIRDGLASTGHAVIIGGGYIGLETAASLRKLGTTVSVLESADRVLARVTAPQVSAFYDRIHREEGVELLLESGVTAFEGQGRVERVRLADDRVIDADMVIIGVGVVPNVELAVEAGLSVDNGITIDSHGRTSDPNVFAAGDCANYFDTRYGCRLRLESVPNAGEQAKVVAATICGKEKHISAVPWFWSDQYDLKLQIVGLSAGYDDVVLRGDPEAGRDFACFYFARDELIAADCVNRPQEFMFGKKVIAQGLSPDRLLLADPDVPLASLMQGSSPTAAR